MDLEEVKNADKLTPQKVQKIYKKHGEDITLKQAELILDFTQRLANIAVAQCLRNEAGSGF